MLLQNSFNGSILLQAGQVFFTILGSETNLNPELLTNNITQAINDSQFRISYYKKVALPEYICTTGQ